MIGLMPVAEILLMDSCDLEGQIGLYDVADILPTKRADEGYDRLVASIRKHGIAVPVLVVDGCVMEGHHRIAAAVDLGLTVVPWTDIELDIVHNPFKPSPINY